MIIIIFSGFSSLSFAPTDKTDYLPPAALPYFAPFSIHRGIFVGEKAIFFSGCFFFLSLFRYTRHRHTNSIFIIFLFIFALRKSSLFFVYAFLNHPGVNTLFPFFVYNLPTTNTTINLKRNAKHQ
uniref:(northern house mosquito) hypothetical protein n=1 Tax=Culex pipiens TaxID=7175 RepID=A0A8D8HT62_CULPI